MVVDFKLRSGFSPSVNPEENPYSRRAMAVLFLNAMAMVSRCGSPDLFIHHYHLQPKSPGHPRLAAAWPAPDCPVRHHVTAVIEFQQRNLPHTGVLRPAQRVLATEWRSVLRAASR